VENDCQGPISEQEAIKKQRNIGEAMTNMMDFLELSPPDLWRLNCKFGNDLFCKLTYQN
jgi:hypothetical protein